MDANPEEANGPPKARSPLRGSLKYRGPVPSRELSPQGGRGPAADQARSPRPAGRAEQHQGAGVWAGRTGCWSGATQGRAGAPVMGRRLSFVPGAELGPERPRPPGPPSPPVPGLCAPVPTPPTLAAERTEPPARPSGLEPPGGSRPVGVEATLSAVGMAPVSLGALLASPSFQILVPPSPPSAPSTLVLSCPHPS